MFQNASRVRFSTSRQSLGCSNRMFMIVVFFLKPAGAAAVGVVFLAKVAVEATLLTNDLHQHDGEEGHPDGCRLPGR